MYLFIKQTMLIWIISLLALSTQAQDNLSIRKQHFNVGKDALAIKGYDPVAYILNLKAVKGSKDWAINHKGILYYFSSNENKEIFKKNPAIYEPQYGGWCAYAMGATAEKVNVDPETFKVINGKLFLFYNKYFNNTLVKWNKDETGLHTKADANWIKLFK